MLCNYGVLGMNQNVIQINKHIIIQKVPEDVIYECLKNCGAPGEAEMHHQIFKIPQRSFEHNFPCIPSLMHTRW